MSRFVDYFVICGYDHTKGRTGNPKESHSQVIQRFPERDWPDIPFIHAIPLFCQPHGWLLTTERQEPKFFVSILTDTEGNRSYCPCLTFSEAIAKDKLGLVNVDEDAEDDGVTWPRVLSASLPFEAPRFLVTLCPGSPSPRVRTTGSCSHPSAWRWCRSTT